nr:hypothetical protein [uncultured Sphaerochaeta sp.]
MTIFRKIVAVTVLATLSSAMIFAAGTTEQGDSPDANNGRSGTITALVMPTEAAGLEAVMAEYQKINPNVKLETIITTSAKNNDTVMRSKIASNDLPDMIYTQVKSIIGDYAKNGYIIPLTDTGIQDRLIEGDDSLLLER